MTTWKKTTPYSWRRDDGAAVISASRHGEVILYSAWVRDDAQMAMHPLGWRCVSIERDPEEARRNSDNQLAAGLGGA